MRGREGDQCPSRIPLFDAMLLTTRNLQSTLLPNPPSSSLVSQLPVPTELIQRRIYLIRGRRSCSIPTSPSSIKWRPSMSKAVRRNLDRFPKDFMFQLVKTEFENLNSNL